MANLCAATAVCLEVIHSYIFTNNLRKSSKVKRYLTTFIMDILSDFLLTSKSFPIRSNMVAMYLQIFVKNKQVVNSEKDILVL